MKTRVLFVLSFFISNCLFGQAFVQPLDESAIGMVKSVVVQEKDGTEVEYAKFGSYTLMNGKLGSFTVKKADGSKKKYKTADVNLVKVEPDGFAKVMMKADNPNLVAALKKDYSAIDKMKYVIFEKVEVKKGKFFLMQLLNPGLDEHIKVYLDPNAKQTMSLAGIIGGEDKSYFVVKGDRTFLLKKKKYKKEIEALYGDSEGLKKMFEGKDLSPKFKDFAVHIALYNESLEGKGGSDAPSEGADEAPNQEATEETSK